MEGARFGGKTEGGFSYRGYGKGFSRESEFHETTTDFDAWHMSQAGFRADRDLGQGGGLTFQGDVYGGRSGQSTVVSSYTAPYLTPVEEDADFSGGNLLGRWRHRTSDASDTSLQVYLDRTRRREPTFEEDRDTFDLEFQQRFVPRGALR